MSGLADVAIQVRDLRMRYGTNDVLKGVSFTARAGEIVALLGPNGAGKSTTIEILEGFRMRSAGQVRVLDEDPADAGERWRARCGVVLQSWRDHAKWRVGELLNHLGAYYAPYHTDGAPGPWLAGDLVAAVGLGAQEHQRVAQLSGGQRRRLDVAIGIVGRPDVLFLDEPTVGFDPAGRHDFHDLLRDLARTQRTTILLTTHDLDEAETLADRILILADGRVIAEGSAEELATRASDQTQVRWSIDGERLARMTKWPARFVADLYREHGDAIADLEVHRLRLVDAYLALVQAAESGHADDAAARFREATPWAR